MFLPSDMQIQGGDEFDEMDSKKAVVPEVCNACALRKSSSPPEMPWSWFLIIPDVKTSKAQRVSPTSLPGGTSACQSRESEALGCKLFLSLCDRLRYPARFSSQA